MYQTGELPLVSLRGISGWTFTCPFLRTCTSSSTVSLRSLVFLHIPKVIVQLLSLLVPPEVVVQPILQLNLANYPHRRYSPHFENVWRTSRLGCNPVHCSERNRYLDRYAVCWFAYPTNTKVRAFTSIFFRRCAKNIFTCSCEGFLSSIFSYGLIPVDLVGTWFWRWVTISAVFIHSTYLLILLPATYTLPSLLTDSRFFLSCSPFC